MSEALPFVASEGNPLDYRSAIGASGVSLRACVIGGPKIIRRSLSKLLEEGGVDVPRTHPLKKGLAPRLECPKGCRCAIAIVVLAGQSLSMLHRVRKMLDDAGCGVPMLVLSERAARAEVYAALKMGAKGYLDLDMEPAELIQAIETAADNRLYLAPSAAEVLASDIVETGTTGNPRALGIELSKRELQVVRLLCDGMSSKEIGRELHISVKTVENHRYNIYRKCKVDGIAGLMRHAIKRGLVAI